MKRIERLVRFAVKDFMADKIAVVPKALSLAPLKIVSVAVTNQGGNHENYSNHCTICIIYSYKISLKILLVNE